MVNNVLMKMPKIKTPTVKIKAPSAPKIKTPSVKMQKATTVKAPKMGNVPMQRKVKMS
jgi:hypothetical protein